ncbi:MAG: selenium metabolism-associated LysR family transcriptional regulator [Bacillota bacterium]
MLDRFQTFIAVADMKNFSKAAKAVNLTQPAVSKQISSLEAEYQVALFARNGRNVELTDAGRILYRHAVEVLEARERMKKALRLFSDKVRGTLLVGASTIPGQYILPVFLGKFVSSYPDVMISVEIGDTKVISDKLLSGALDVAVVGASICEPGVVSQAFAEDEIVLIVPPSHRLAGRTEVSLDDLVSDGFVWREKGSATREVVEQVLGSRVLQLNKVMELGSTEAVLSAVEAGAGLAFVSKWATAESGRGTSVKVLRLKGTRICRQLYISYLKAREYMVALEVFVTFLRKAMETRLTGSGLP